MESPPPDVTLDVAGRPQVPGYVYEGDIGAGGMGTVYRYRDPSLDRLAAVKVIHPRILDDDARERFRREARILARLDHENVVRIFAFLDNEDTACLVMEYVEGSTLESLLKRGHFEPSHVVNFVAQAAAGLEAAWREGLVHRDIKPANLLVDRKGRLHIADFGLAKPVARDASEQTVSGRGLVRGTPAYMSPEQARAEPLDHRSDIYALGVVFFELLTGAKPHPGEARPSLAQRNPGLSPGLVDLVSSMLTQDRERRIASYADIRSRLQELPEASQFGSGPTVTIADLLAAPDAEEDDSIARTLFRRVGSASRWWEIDLILAIVVMAPLWGFIAYKLDEWDPFNRGALAMFAICLCQTWVTVFRLYLLLVAAAIGGERISQVERFVPWIRPADYALMIVTFASGLMLLPSRRFVGVSLIALSLAGTLKFRFLDPFLLEKAKQVWRTRSGASRGRTPRT